MKVIQIRHFGGPEVLKLADVPQLSPGPGQVLVRVRAAGVNFAETLMRENRYAMTPPLPAVLGSEVAGTIEAIGDGVEGLKVGSRVAAPLFAAGLHFGGYAESALIDHRFVVPLPDAISFEQATALMVQGLTALYLTKQASPSGKTVFISAAAGGVGSLLVQLARLSGAARIIAAASTPAKRDFALALGADATVDYTTTSWVDAARDAAVGPGLDIIYESVGGPVTTDSLKLLAPGGELVIYGALNIQSFQLGVPELLGLIFKNQSVTGFALVPLLSAASLRCSLTELFTLAAGGRIKVTIGGSFPLEQAAEAHRMLESRATAGKVVLVP